MCGITGAIWTDPSQAIDAATLARMVEVLRHRGPDDAGEYRSDLHARPGRGTLPGVALGHRRLAIIGVASGHQPMANEDESVWVVFNGEIYNHRRLRRRLEGAGHRFRSESDTEVLVHLWEDAGVAMLEHLDGMFALALWDARRGKLLLARDRLGKKPLVYRHEPGRLLFASQLKSLLEAPGIPRRLDPTALDEYLVYQYVPHPRTIFQGISKLPPAHYALWQDGRLRLGRYWNPDLNAERQQPEADWIDQLRSTLTEAVQARLESEVPLGAFLSGGVDSTIVVGLMQKLAGEPVRTFTIGFPVRECDETAYARLAARELGTQHREFRVEPEAVGVLEKLVWHYDEPFADTSAVPTWYVSELTRRHVTVALTGDGGDELFAGYPRYRAADLAAKLDRLPGPLRRALATRLWQSLPASGRQKSLLRRWKRFTEVLDQPPLRRYLDWISIFNEARRAELYTEVFVADLPDHDPIELLRQAAARASARDPVTQTSLADILTYLPCDLLTKVDVASMAHSLECRQPFLDHRVVELAAAMPLELKYRHGRGKRILLRAFSDLLPRAIRRRQKMGFGVPLDAWFRGPLAGLARDVLLDPKIADRGYFRPEALARLLEEHQSGRFDHSYRLWSLVFFELWHRRWLD